MPLAPAPEGARLIRDMLVLKKADIHAPATDDSAPRPLASNAPPCADPGKTDTPPRTVTEVRESIFEAGLRRRRPALMTTMTTLLALVPVLWATGRGADLMQPMIPPVLGGMIFDLLSRFSVPVFYAWYWERRVAREAKTQAV